jgi:hypothetical protein
MAWQVLLASDDAEPFTRLAQLLPSLRIVSVPASRFLLTPGLSL